MLYTCLIITGITLILFLCQEIEQRRNFNNLRIFRENKISPSNKIRFAKLQKDYLDKLNIDEIEQLDIFISQYYEKRLENENKK